MVESGEIWCIIKIYRKVVDSYGNNNEAELQEFLRYIREDESYDERGNLNADLTRQI